MNKNLLLSLLVTLLCYSVQAQVTKISGSAGSGAFGTNITVLANGNYIVTDPKWSNGGITEVGAVYLYNGASHALISTLTGSQTNDHVGSGGISVLSNGNYVVKSPEWDNASISNAGAVTWGNGVTGLSGVVSTANSLVGSKASDQVGYGGVAALSNGNYVVVSYTWDNASVSDAGAATWGNGTTGVSGTVSSSNSLVGSSASDYVGVNGVVALSNGNYLIRSAYWNNASVTDAGAITWGNGTIGVSGTVSSSNSLVGSSQNDGVGTSGLVPLSNGNCVAVCAYWDNASVSNAGAVTLINSTTGVSGTVGSSNSLVGSNVNDYVGINGIVALSNGNYVVISSSWDNASVSDAGAVTWGSGTAGVMGMVSASNSLVGSATNDIVGNNGVTPIGNGNYVVSSPYWDNASVGNAGAVTWANGTTGVMGAVSTSNSLVGSTANDYVGGGGVTALGNNNYLVRSPSWDNASITDAGAATWGNGTAGVKGIVSASNSLVGATANDYVGDYNVVALGNGNYVVCSPNWDNASVSNAGAVTWGNGTTGVAGLVSISNSLVGSTANDYVGSSGVTALANGNYVVSSSNWDNASIIEAGAVTWGSGTAGVAGAVSVSNSLVGSTADDYVGSNGITALVNGNYVVSSSSWDNASVIDAGAVTWGNGIIGVTGIVSASNSLVGSTVSDAAGSGGITVLSNGNYVVRSPNWDNASIIEAGAVTWGSGTAGVKGMVGASNSLVGSTASDMVGGGSGGGGGVFALIGGNYVVSSPKWNNDMITLLGAVTWGNGAVGVRGVVSTSNSLVGSTAGDQVGSGGIATYSNRNYVIKSSSFNNGLITAAGALTYGSGANGVSGIVNNCNSVLGAKADGGPSQNHTFNPVYDYLLVGYNPGNFYVIHNGSPLADDNTTVTETIGSDPVIFLSDCSPIGKITPTGDANDVNGQVSMKVYVASTAPVSGQPYVRRYYDITPATGSNSATARITLFYSQADFDDFNANRGSNPALPEDTDDEDGIENLRITQNHGTSTTGAPGSYTGWNGDGPAAVLINPEDKDILWNSVEKRWEVSFDVTGFSGFFVHSNVNETVLPVRLVSFTAQKAEDHALLQWKTTSEVNASHFDIERSVDGKNFNMIGMVQATGNGDGELTYFFTDTEFSSLNQIAYYRLRSVDADGSYAFSRIERLQPHGNLLSDYIYPNPARTGSVVTIKSVGKPGDVQVLDLTGRKIEARVNQRIGNGFVIDPLPQGIYLIRFTTQTGSETRKLVVE